MTKWTKIINNTKGKWTLIGKNGQQIDFQSS